MEYCGNSAIAYGVTTSIGLLLNVWVWDNKIQIPTTLRCRSVLLHTVYCQSPIPYTNSNITSKMLMFLSEIETLPLDRIF